MSLVSVPQPPASRKVPPLVEKLQVRSLSAWRGSQALLRDVTLSIPQARVTAIVGPSGCGKSTFVRCLNRLHEEGEGTRVSGQVLLDATDIYARGTSLPLLRRRIGMVFPRPNVFPAMSVRDNMLAALRLSGIRPSQPATSIEHVLRQVSLWSEVKDHLDQPATDLPLGLQQRLCLARCLSLEPEILLMDEPCSSLDREAGTHLEELIHELRAKYTIVVATHNPQQAARIADFTAVLLDGELIEHGDTDSLFTRPRDHRTEDYLTGRFG